MASVYEIIHRIEAAKHPKPWPRGDQAVDVGHDQRLRCARAYLAHIPPAIEGQRGDEATFQAACKLVRGFTLDDETALRLMLEWNRGCEAQWTERELQTKIESAHRNGQEPFGGRIDAPRQDASPA